MRIRRIALAAGACLLGVLVLSIAGGLAYRAFRQHENAGAMTIISPNGIDEAMFAPIGGIEQWITIRGWDRNNPVLLYVDGGPGGATSPFNVFSRWEKVFTVVQWDQRGAGKT
jgi:hypothetical protein